MKNRLIICLAIAITVTFLAPLHTAQCQDYYTYTVEVQSDGSARWTITQFSDVNAPTTSWASYQQKIYTLVNQAANATGRPMAVDANSFEINTTLSAESKITEYMFVWLNFTSGQGNELVVGDVFKVNTFFSQLFGDASIQLTYPKDYTPKTVDPSPYERQDSLDSMKWARTQDLADGVEIVLAPIQQSNGGNEPAQSSFISLALVGVAVPVGVVGFIVYRKRRSSDRAATVEVAVPSALESDEDRVLKLLKAQGGSMRQTEVTENLGFSKAKTSQLLSELETRGVLARYKKGRDKIVTIRKGDD